jgi:hypothetical protein
MDRHSAYKNGPPTYKTVGTPRELSILRLYAQYDLLPSDYIYHALGNYQATRKALTQLAKGHYIGLPKFDDPDETLAFIPRNRNYVFELKTRGKTLLRRHDIDLKAGMSDHFKHKLLRSKIEFLLERVPLTVISPEAILNHPLCPAETRNAKEPFLIPPKPHLEPDITRGFGLDGTYIFLHIEVDRGNEPAESFKKRQSFRSKVERYRQYFEERAYKTHFGFAVAPSILFMTTREHTETLHNVISDYAGDWRHRFFYTTIDPKPLPTTNLIVPWQGVDGALDLTEVLGAPNGQTRPSPEGSGAFEADQRQGS